MQDSDITADISPVERYTYTYDMSSQQLDHMLVSPAIADKTISKFEYEHIHVNTWAKSYEERTSDHDPSVGRMQLCLANGGAPTTMSSTHSTSSASITRVSSHTFTSSASTITTVSSISSVPLSSTPSSITRTMISSSPSPTPSVACSHRIGSWCAAPLPEFNDFSTCLYVPRPFPA